MKVAVPLCSPISTVWEFQLLHTLTSTQCCLSLMLAILVCIQWHITVILVCIFLTNDVQHLFRCLTAIHICSFMKCHSNPLLIFKLGWFLRWLQLSTKGDSTSDQFDLELVIWGFLMALLGSKLLARVQVKRSKIYGMHKSDRITLLLKTCQWLPSTIRIKSKLFTLASKARVIWPLHPSPTSSLAIFPLPTMLLILWSSFHPSNTPHSSLCPLCLGSYFCRVPYAASF